MKYLGTSATYLAEVLLGRELAVPLGVQRLGGQRLSVPFGSLHRLGGQELAGPRDYRKQAAGLVSRRLGGFRNFARAQEELKKKTL